MISLPAVLYSSMPEINPDPEMDFFSTATPLFYLQKEIPHLKADNSNEGGKNSSYEAPEAKAKDVRVWEDFFANGEIRQMVHDPRWMPVLTQPFTKQELRRLTWDHPESGGNINELTFELIWHQITSALNLIHLKCAQRVTGLSDPPRIKIGHGTNAEKVTSLPYREHKQRKNYIPSKVQKKPDYAGYQYVPGSNQTSRQGRKTVDNRIPGDAKLFRKIRRSMMPPDGAEFNKRNLREIEKVLTQIHDYMDRHEARYGYIVNDEELIFFRRRGTGWGHMDISPGIRHDVDGTQVLRTGSTSRVQDLECRISSTKLLLFYFHLVIAPDESKWKLPTCRPLINLRPHLPRYAKGTMEINGVTPNYRMPDEFEEDWE